MRMTRMHCVGKKKIRGEQKPLQWLYGTVFLEVWTLGQLQSGNDVKSDCLLSQNLKNKSNG